MKCGKQKFISTFQISTFGFRLSEFLFSDFLFPISAFSFSRTHFVPVNSQAHFHLAHDLLIANGLFS
jgi:hypothetical protein